MAAEQNHILILINTVDFSTDSPVVSLDTSMPLICYSGNALAEASGPFLSAEIERSHRQCKKNHECDEIQLYVQVSSMSIL